MPGGYQPEARSSRSAQDDVPIRISPIWAVTPQPVRLNNVDVKGVPMAGFENRSHSDGGGRISWWGGVWADDSGTSTATGRVGAGYPLPRRAAHRPETRADRRGHPRQPGGDHRGGDGVGQDHADPEDLSGAG